MRLVADIGGTNARLALCEDGKIVPHTVQSFANEDWPHLYNVVAAFLEPHAVRLEDIVLAVAGPVQSAHATLTNRNWTIERAGLIERFGCENAFLLNDLSALGYAVPALEPAQLHRLHDGGGTSVGVGQFLVVGIGTGFNVSPILKTHNGVHCLAVEAGHVSMPISIAELIKQSRCNASLFPTVEDLFSGRGFAKFCRKMTGDETLQGRDVIRSYEGTKNPALTDAVDSYVSLLGQLLRELTLAYMPSTGVYLAGSVARAVVKTAPPSCLETFARPCEIRGAQSPNLFMIEDDFAALHGCAAFEA